MCIRDRPVPEHLTGLQNSAHPGQRCFRRKRHKDLPVPRAGAGVGGRDGVVPEAVKIIITFPHELRAGIFLQNSVLVQRFGDLVKGVRTNEHRLAQSYTRPTLTAAVPGDLSLALPKRQLDDIIEMIYALDKIAPGTANYDTLLYGAEVKFYSSRLELSGELETKFSNFFAIGDGAGITRGLMQASVTGVVVAREIANRL